jgi:hypothetical protein
MDVIQVLVVILLIVLFIAGLASVADALARCDSSPKQIAKGTSAEIEQIVSEGERAMDDLSEQYLNEVYDQVTHQRKR